MLKKFSTLALAGLLALPAVASAGSSDMAAQIDRLTRELEALKSQMSAMSETRGGGSGDSAAIAELKAEVASMKNDQEDAWDDLDLHVRCHLF